MFPGFNSPIAEGKFDNLSNIVAKVEISTESVGTKVFIATAANFNNLPEELGSIRSSEVFLQDLKKHQALWSYGE